MWAITAQFKSVTEIWNKNGYSRYEGSKQIPAFYLDENVQGITSEDHAKKIALEILNPAGEYDETQFSVTAVKVGAVYCDDMNCRKEITKDNPSVAHLEFPNVTLNFCKSCEGK